MHIERLDLADADTIRDCFEVFLAAQKVDEPDGPWFTLQPFQGWLTVGWGGDPREAWVVPGPDEGSVAGWYRLEMPDLENLDQADLMLVVHPAQRRHGLGRALLRHAAARAAEHGRSVLMLTGVTRQHRGHRLGLLVKTAMAQWLKAAEPTVERIQTWNAESNRYMIAVNEALGYTILGQPAISWRLEVPAVLGDQALAGQARHSGAPTL
jgi:GNAT superfamily N-acetyltransferase